MHVMKATAHEVVKQGSEKLKENGVNVDSLLDGSAFDLVAEKIKSVANTPMKQPNTPKVSDVSHGKSEDKENSRPVPRQLFKED